MILVFLGPPGSGKGTQAKRFAQENGWPQLSTGDMLRAAIANGTKLGLEAKSFMDRGDLVPDQVVIGLIAERSQGPDCKSGFILDGFPRTIPQARALDQLLASQGQQVDRVILFEIPDEKLVRRLAGRRTCSKCGEMFHMETRKPKVDGKCDRCGGALIQRDDDQVQVIQKRLQVYHSQTAPLAAYYREQKKLKPIDATLSMDQVHEVLSSAIAVTV